MKNVHQAGGKSSRASHQKQPSKQAAARPPKPAGQGIQWVEVELPATALPYIDRAAKIVGLTQDQFIETAVREKIARNQTPAANGCAGKLPMSKENTDEGVKPGEETLMIHARFEFQQGVDFALFALGELRERTGDIGFDEAKPFTRKEATGLLWLAGRAIRQLNIACNRAYKCWAEHHPEEGNKGDACGVSVATLRLWVKFQNRIELAQWTLAEMGLFLSEVEIDAHGRMKESPASEGRNTGLWLTAEAVEECLKRDSEAIVGLLRDAPRLQPHPLAPGKFRAPNPPGMVQILGTLDSSTERVHVNPRRVVEAAR